MTQTTDYRFFDGESVTLRFGDECAPLYVQEGILQKIPFFTNALKFADATPNGTSSKSGTKTIGLHDCDAKAVADVIHYTFTDVPSIARKDSEGTSHRDHRGEEVRLYTKAWIVADRFGLENIANILIDRIVDYSQEWSLNPVLTTVLVQADHEQSRICEFFIHDIAHELLQRDCYSKRWCATFCAEGEQRVRGENCRHFESICETLFPSILVRILCATQTVKGCPAKYALENPCTLHKHEVTDPCPQSGRGNGTDVDDRVSSSSDGD